MTVFVNGERRLSAPGQGGTEHYFKFGVYKQSHHQPSRRMESRWKNVAVYTKPSLPETASSPCASRFAVCFSSDTR